MCVIKREFTSHSGRCNKRKSCNGDASVQIGLRHEVVERNHDASSLVRIEEVECDEEAAEMIRTGICQCMTRAS